MFRATAEAARRVGCKVNLVLAGWADTPSIQQKFERGAEALAPGVRVTFVDGMRPEHRYHVWKAADIFTSMSDNIQETLGLTILEAQACGLPVVTTDWNGCRENVTPGETGFTIPTRMVAGATVDGTSRHLMGETSYGAFLGETNQTVAVDTREAVAAFSRLFADEGLRSVMGAAGRARVLGHSTWPLVIQRYEAIWREQDALRRDHAATAKASLVRTPVPFPDVEFAFASYPSAVLDVSTLVEAADDAALQLELLLRLPITNYVPHSRVVEPLVLSSLLRAAQTACTLATLEAILVPCGASSERRRATLAWLLKYDLLRIVPV